MVRCADTRYYCFYRRKGNCENSQGECPSDTVIRMFESGKTLEQIEDETDLDQLDIHEILEDNNLL